MHVDHFVHLSLFDPEYGNAVSVWESFPFCCFSFVASESSFFVGQTFWSSLSFFVLMFLFFFVFLGCLTPNEPELIDNFGCNRWF
ncbi:unnamed protein product [Rhizophagus irregularis]|nr:unnamed protein product [Rhizophagus irregularis]